MKTSDRPRPHILVVCGRNKRRSRTAEYLFKNDDRIYIRSVGLSPKSDRQIRNKDLQWAHLILVMEDEHKKRVESNYQDLEIPPIDVLHIEDIYEFRDPELVEMLVERIDLTLKEKFNI